MSMDMCLSVMGLSLVEYWELSPLEFRLVERAAVERNRRDKKLVALGAWIAEGLSRDRRIPSLKSTLAAFDPEPTHGDMEARRLEHEELVRGVNKAR